MTEELMIGLAIGSACAISAYPGIPWYEILESVTTVLR